MVKLLIAFGLVAAFLVGALMSLRHYRLGLPSKDVIDRVKEREKALEAQERAEEERRR